MNEIIRKIERIDRNRADYYKCYTGRNWNDASNYDMCLNTTSMSYPDLISVVKSYIKVHHQGWLENRQGCCVNAEALLVVLK